MVLFDIQKRQVYHDTYTVGEYKDFYKFLLISFRDSDFFFFQITIPDVKKVYQLFIDEQRSQKFLKEYEDEFMFDEGKAP